MFDKVKNFFRRDKLPGSTDAGATNESVVTSTARSPSEESLDLVFRGATSVRVFAGGVSGGKPMSDELLLEIDHGDDIAELRECLTTTTSGFHCMCLGDHAIEVRGPRGVQSVIGLHHGKSIRWCEFRSDAMLLDGRKLLEWLAERGAADPLREFDAEEERHRISTEKMEHAEKAVPTCLQPYENLLHDIGPMGDFRKRPDPTDKLLSVLRAAYPIEKEAILVLFAWFGHQRDMWNMAYGHEFAAKALLEQFSTKSIIESLESAPLSIQHIEGAARLFAGIPDVRDGNAARAHLPPALIARLRAHVQEDPTKENRERFAIAFPDHSH